MRLKTIWRHLALLACLIPSSFCLCEVEVVHHKDMTREFIMNRFKPMIIKGVTENWTALDKWSEEGLLKHYGDELYHLDLNSSLTVREAISEERYLMGHATYPPGDSCYHPKFRPYSPWLLRTEGDYDVPGYLAPMQVFQVGFARGWNQGVPPERHPSSWFALVSGRKRWRLMPPQALMPFETLRREPKGCHPTSVKFEGLTCDQEPGDVLFVPGQWWHETCGLDYFTIGVGGITYPGADEWNQSQCPRDEFSINELQNCGEQCPESERLAAAWKSHAHNVTWHPQMRNHIRPPLDEPLGIGTIDRFTPEGWVHEAMEREGKTEEDLEAMQEDFKKKMREAEVADHSVAARLRRREIRRQYRKDEWEEKQLRRKELEAKRARTAAKRAEAQKAKQEKGEATEMRAAQEQRTEL